MSDNSQESVKIDPKLPLTWVIGVCVLLGVEVANIGFNTVRSSATTEQMEKYSEAITANTIAITKNTMLKEIESQKIDTLSQEQQHIKEALGNAIKKNIDQDLILDQLAPYYTK